MPNFGSASGLEEEDPRSADYDPMSEEYYTAKTGSPTASGGTVDRLSVAFSFAGGVGPATTVEDGDGREIVVLEMKRLRTLRAS